MPYADPQRAKEYRRAYTAQNPPSKEKMREYQRAYRLRHKDKLLEKSRAHEKTEKRIRYNRKRNKERWQEQKSDPEFIAKRKEVMAKYVRTDEYRENRRQRYLSESKSLTPEQKRQLRRKFRYGITPERYDEILSGQNGVCAICQIRIPADIDHCHETGKIRGLLCRGCNVGLGQFGDSIEGLQRAIEYLRKDRQ